MSTTNLKDRIGGKLQAQPESEERDTTMTETSLAPVNSGYLALTNNALEVRLPPLQVVV